MPSFKDFSTDTYAGFADVDSGLSKAWLAKHPDDSADPADPDFSLHPKPRGIFDSRYLGALDKELEVGPSPVIAAQINKTDGQFGRRDSSDVAAPDEFAALLRHVRDKLAALADQLISGDVSVSPYRLGRQSPCSDCEFRPVCRFDPSINRYHLLPQMKRTEVLDRVTRGTDAG